MDDKNKDAARDSRPRKYFLDGEKAIKGITAKGWWMPSFLARMVAGGFFVQTAWGKLIVLDHTKDVLNFFWIALPAGHRWDPCLPGIELLLGVFLLLGFLTRFSAVLLLGIMGAAFLDVRLRGLAGVNLFAFQEFAVMALLAVLCAAGAGPASIDRFVFKRNTPEAD
jgi:uncharacterized membrane protein YphA (DoxX/SURF4 family)